MSLTPWQIFTRVPNAERIAAGLNEIPSHWSLTPLQEKKPRRKNWQTEAFIPHKTIESLILNGDEAVSQKTGKPYRRFWSGFGVRLGEASDGLLAIDVDGASAQPILEAMSGGSIPRTVSWSSGKPGRYQLLFQIPENLRGKFKNFTRAVITKWGNLETLKDENGKPIELLEFRYNRSQSALPPSLHPSTGSYGWGNSPANTEVVLAPDWLCEILVQLADTERQMEEAKLEAKRQRAKVVAESHQRRKALGIVGSFDLVDAFSQSIHRLTPEEIFNWNGHNFKQRGREWFGCCPQHQSQSGESFTVNPNSLEWYCYGCNVGGEVGEYRLFVKGGKGTPRGKDFYEITKELAAQAGIELPKPTEQKKGFSKDCQEKTKPFERNYLKPIRELPQTGFHVIRRSQDDLLQVFDVLSTKRGQEWLQLRKFTPDVIINSQYFNYDCKPGENLAVNSGLGTGKSYYVNADWLANPDDGAVLGGYRNCLNEQFCANGKKLNGRPWYQIQSDLKNSQDAALINDPQSRIAGAVDSWVYFTSDNFDGKKVIFDEVESVAKHLNQSNTAVSFYREIVKQRVQAALQNSKANLIADGNLRDFTVEYFEKLSGRKFTKILNEYKGNRGHIYLFNGSSRKRQATEEDVKNGLANEVDEWISFDHKANDYSKLHRTMMELPIDIPCLILSDSQNKCEAWDTELAALGRKVFRLDSTNSQTDLGKQFLENPKEFILNCKIDCVILSPSAESGISIELQDELKREIPGYFQYEFGFFFGVSVTDTVVQFLGRNRDPFTTKFAYIQTHSIDLNKQITNEDTSTTIQQNWTDLALYCASLSLEGLEEGEILRLATNEIQKKLADPHLQYESKLVLKESFERANPRLCLEYALREAGWGVTVIEGREDTIEDLQTLQAEIAQKRAVAVFQSQNTTPTESEKLARKLNKTPEERHQITKSKLLSRLPGIETKTVVEQIKVTVPEQLQKIEQCDLTTIVTVGDIPYREWKESSQPLPEKGIEIKVEKPAFSPDFIHKVLDKDRAFVSRLEAQYLLKHPELCKIIQQHKWHKKLSAIFDPDSVTFGGLPVSRYRSRWVEVHTLLEMGIGFFLNCENSWHDESPEAIAFWKQGSKPHIAKRIGVAHEDSPCTYIGKVLKKFGLKTQDKQKSRPDKTRYREYSIAHLDPLSQAVYECVEQRINNQVSEFVFDWKKIVQNSTFKTAETTTEKALQAAHLPPDNYIKTRGEVCSVAGAQFIENQGVSQPLDGVARETDPVADLVEAFPYCYSPETFADVIEWYNDEVIREAIALQDSEHRRQELQQWLELAQVKSTAGEKLAQSPAVKDVIALQDSQQPVERQWGITREQAESISTVEWIGRGLFRIAYAAFDYAKLTTGTSDFFVKYQELRVPG